jgi:hypothetical protein
LSGSANAPEFLGDYLAYADAALQDYLATGRVVSLRNGAAVLERALQLFAGETPGAFRAGLQPESGVLPGSVSAPEILDSSRESLTACLIRLCSAYGRLLLSHGREGDPGLLLLRTAFASTALFAAIAEQLGVFAASYVCAAAAVADDAFAVAVGPNARELSDALFRLRPTRLVAPAFGPVRVELQGAAPGLYVIRRGVAAGPMSVEQAAQAMPVAFDVGNEAEPAPAAGANAGRNAP